MDNYIFEEQYLMENNDFYFDYTSKTNDIAEKISEDDGSGYAIHYTDSYYLLATPRYGRGFYLAKSYISKKYDNKYKLYHHVRVYKILSRLVIVPNAQDPRKLDVKEVTNANVKYSFPLTDMQSNYSLMKPYLRAYILRKYGKIVTPEDYYMQKAYAESEAKHGVALAAFQAEWKMKIKRSEVTIGAIDNYESIITDKDFYNITFHTVNDDLPLLKDTSNLSIQATTMPSTYSTLMILDNIIHNYADIINKIKFFGVYQDGNIIRENNIHKIKNMITLNTRSRYIEDYLNSAAVRIHFKG